MVAVGDPNRSTTELCIARFRRIRCCAGVHHFQRPVEGAWPLRELHRSCCLGDRLQTFCARFEYAPVGRTLAMYVGGSEMFQGAAISWQRLTLSESTEQSGLVLILSSVSAPPSTCQSLFRLALKSSLWRTTFRRYWLRGVNPRQSVRHHNRRQFARALHEIFRYLLLWQAPSIPLLRFAGPGPESTR